jgi:hypothetical protein
MGHSLVEEFDSTIHGLVDVWKVIVGHDEK